MVLKKISTPTKKTTAPPSVHPLAYAQHWPTDLLPLAMFGINGDRTVLATAIQQMRPQDFFAKKWQDFALSKTAEPKWIGILPYDEFCPFTERKLQPFIYEIHEALVWQDSESAPKLTSPPNSNLKSCALKITAAQLKDLEKEIAKTPLPLVSGNTLHPTMSDETYLGQVHDVVAEIRRGTFYQINLLRYFRFDKSWKWPQVCGRLSKHGGPLSAVFRHGNAAIASFSPERFVSIEVPSEGPRIHTWPIKGTSTRDLKDESQDRLAKDALLKSEKDLAELHMIVDLMRNDLQRVCLPKTVEVPVPHQVLTFAHVHHLQSHVCGQLRPDISMGDLFAALMPGGSITGAPKLEAMKQIRQFEGRDRGYFMGNAFVINSDGSMDSNILIRTMTSSDGCRTWEYAAGSGLVIKSDAQTELQEIAAKCRPITE